MKTGAYLITSPLLFHIGSFYCAALYCLSEIDSQNVNDILSLKRRRFVCSVEQLIYSCSTLESSSCNVLSLDLVLGMGSAAEPLLFSFPPPCPPPQSQLFLPVRPSSHVTSGVSCAQGSPSSHGLGCGSGSILLSKFSLLCCLVPLPKFSPSTAWSLCPSSPSSVAWS